MVTDSDRLKALSALIAQVKAKEAVEPFSGAA
jgi:hypothetical protein